MHSAPELGLYWFLLDGYKWSIWMDIIDGSRYQHRVDYLIN